MVLYFTDAAGHRLDTVGPEYFLRLADSTFMEEEHMFTAFATSAI
jgi:hypothetical protein